MSEHKCQLTIETPDERLNKKFTASALKVEPAEFLRTVAASCTELADRLDQAAGKGQAGA